MCSVQLAMCSVKAYGCGRFMLADTSKLLSIGSKRGNVLPAYVLLRFVHPHAGLVLLEVSVVVFLLQGYITSGREV